MSKSKFERSQAAHRRLFTKHNNVFGSFIFDVKADYHFDVLRLQHKSRKLLSEKEKKVVFDSSFERVFGKYPKGSKTKRSDYIDVIRKHGL